MERLSSKTLSLLPEEVGVPNYDRTQLKPKIVHLGIGAFHRGHQAAYLDQILNEQGGDWGIVGVCMRSDTVARQLVNQDCLYTLVEKSQVVSCRVIGSIHSVIVAPNEPKKVIQHIAAKETVLVSLTVTEKGYCHNPANGKLNTGLPEIQQEIGTKCLRPTTAIGFLVAGLFERYQKGMIGITVLSCDNLPGNGHILYSAVMGLAGCISDELLQWIERNVTFPCSMVDRIVPATTKDKLIEIQDVLGVADQGAICCEPFSQWVIENNFAQPLPNYASVGAILTDDVSLYEKIKLRLLNGSHSLIAYLGYLCGCNYVHEVVAKPLFLQLIKQYFAMCSSVLNVPLSFDLETYQTLLISRFMNPSLKHQTFQIAMDGSQEIPPRWLETLDILLSDGKDATIMALLIAGWIKYLQGVRYDGEQYNIVDPIQDNLLRLVEQINTGGLQAILSCNAIFGDLVERSPKFVQQVSEQFVNLNSLGVEATIALATSQ